MELAMDYDIESTDIKPRKQINFGAILGSAVPAVLVLFTIIYLSFFQQDMLHTLLKKYDILGITDTGHAEKYRLYTINNLDIPFEQRQALKQGTIFIGATTKMVELALGNPAQPIEKALDGSQKWVYYFSGSSRPTYLIFANDKLVTAQNGSTIDNAEIQ